MPEPRMNPCSVGDPRPNLIILSDLHWGEGLRMDLPRYAPLEDFFHDQAFARCLGFLRAGVDDDPARLVLVLNGDIFDFLTVTRVPRPEEPESALLHPSRTERRFGLDPTPARSVFKLELIARGHPVCFQALADWLAAGFRIEILRGNHDLELFFPEVQNRLRELLCARPSGPTPESTDRLLRFHPWFYLEPGRVYIEHGHQYEASNSIRYPLRPVLPSSGRRDEEACLDYPLGSLFVRYFYNRVRRLDPYTPKVISFEHYLDFLRRYNFLDLMRVYRAHYPFFLSALQSAAAVGRSHASAADDQQEAEDFQQLAADTLLPKQLQDLNRLKIHPLSASKLALVKQMMFPILKRTSSVAGLTVLAVFVWFLIFNAIHATPWLANSLFFKVTLLTLFAILTLLVLFWAGNVLGSRLRRRSDTIVNTCSERADHIARILGVKLVVMGHTHVVDVRMLAQGAATYANGGTWTAVDNPWKQIHPDARLRTFLRVQGDGIELVRWNDDASRVDPVPLFDLAPGSRLTTSGRSKPRTDRSNAREMGIDSSPEERNHKRG